MNSLLEKLFVLIDAGAPLPRCCPDASGRWTAATADEEAEWKRSYAEELPDLLEAYLALRVEFDEQKRLESKADPSPAYTAARRAVEDAGGMRCFRELSEGPLSAVITPSTLTELRPGIWLGDEIITFCFILMGTVETHATRAGAQRKAHYAPSTLYTSVYDHDHTYDFDKVKAWSTAKMLKYSMLHCDKIFIPLNKPRQHWTLMVVDLVRETMTIFDSMHNASGPFTKRMLQVFDNVERWVRDCSVYAQKHEPRDLEREAPHRTFSTEPFARDVPSVVQQRNCADCGIFAVLFAWCVASNMDPARQYDILGKHFERYGSSSRFVDVDRFRMLIAQDIMHRGNACAPEHTDEHMTAERKLAIREGTGEVDLTDDDPVAERQLEEALVAERRLDAAKKNSESSAREVVRTEALLPALRSNRVDAVISMYLETHGLDKGCHEVGKEALAEFTALLRPDPRRIYFTERLRAPENRDLRKHALAMSIKQTYDEDGSAVPFETIASEVVESFRLVRLINDFLSEYLFAYTPAGEPAPDWAGMLVHRLPPIGRFFEATDAQDVRNALEHFHCPHPAIYEIFQAAQDEASVEDDSVIELMDCSASESAGSDSDEDGAKIIDLTAHEWIARKHAMEDLEADLWLEET